MALVAKGRAGEADGGVAQVVVAAEAIDALSPEWAALHAAIPGATPFTHPAFVGTWLRHFGAGHEPTLLAFRKDERLVGVAALELSGATAVQLGEPDVCDYAGPLALPGEEGAVADTLFEFFNEDMTRSSSLWGMREGDAMREPLFAAAHAHGWAAQAEAEAASPGLDLPGTWEAYVESLPKKDRHELRRKLRRIEAAGDVRYSSTGEVAEVAQGMDALLDQMRHSRPEKAVFLTAATEAFFRELAATMAEAGLMRLGTLRLDGEAVARLFTFEDAGCVYLYNSGFEPELSELAVGLLSKALAIRDAIERGKRRFDFLRGDEEYKRRLGGAPHAVLRLEFRR